MELFDTSMTIMERSLDVRMTNQRVIASNLANVDTPGYVARKLDFEQSLANALAGTENPAVIEASAAPQLSLDGNNVDLEDELSAMNRNKTMYNLTAQIMAAKFRQMNTALDSER